MSEGSIADSSEKTRLCNELVAEVGKVLVGQDAMVSRLLIGLLTGGHVLLEGFPGLAKTLAVRCLSRAIGTGFSRYLHEAILVAPLYYNINVTTRTSSWRAQRRHPVRQFDVWIASACFVTALLAILATTG